MKSFSHNITIAIVSASMACAFNVPSFASGSGSTGAPAPVEAVKDCKLRGIEEGVLIETIGGLLSQVDCEDYCMSYYLQDLAGVASRNATVASGRAVFVGDPDLYTYQCRWGDDLQLFYKVLEIPRLEYIVPEEAGDGPGPDLDGAA